MENLTIKISFESVLDYLPFLRGSIRGICSCVTQNEQILQDIDLCLNEALCNTIHHAYCSEPVHEIQILVTLHSKEVILQIIDFGLKNLQLANFSLPEVDLNNIDSLSESGRGLFLIHKLMDEVVYKGEKDQNILILRKRFN